MDRKMVYWELYVLENSAVHFQAEHVKVVAYLP